jgi:hypothetical protein
VNLPPEYREFLLSDLEPGQVYRRCLERLQSDGLTADYQLTETLVYGVEVRYALQVLEGRAPQLYNFGDLDGKGDPVLFQALRQASGQRVAFVGCGPYPVTALLTRRESPDARVTCFDNQIVAFLLARAVLARLDPEIGVELADASEIDYRGYDVIVLAAMVGNKEPLVGRLLAETQAQVVVRGSVPGTHPRLHTVSSQFRADGSL